MTLLTPSIYNRNYQRDVEGISPESPSTFQRIILAALPVLSFYTPVQQVLSLSMDGVRTISSLALLKKPYEDGNWWNGSAALLQGTVAVTAIAGTYFAHPVGLVINNGYELFQSLTSGDLTQALTQAVYLSMFLSNSVELAVLLLLFQLATDMVKLRETKREQYIELVGHVLVISLRSLLLAVNISTFLLKITNNRTIFIDKKVKKLFEESGKQDKDKVALFIYAKSDHNGALGDSVSEIKDLAEKYQLRKAVVESPQELYQAIEGVKKSLKNNQSFDLLVIKAHGFRYGFQFGFGSDGFMLISDLSSYFFNYIEKTVVLMSCSTGKEGGIANFLAFLIPGRKVYAPKEDVPGITCLSSPAVLFYDTLCSKITYNTQTQTVEANFYTDREITRVYAY